MKIGLYFGSFNPVHVGHLIIAESILELTNLEEIWMIVSPLNPFKEQKELLDHYKRLEMVKIATRGNKKIKGSNVEFDLPIPSYTIDTLRYLEEKTRNKTFSLIMGEDNLEGLDKWKESKELIRNYSIYVYPRLGYTTDKYKDHDNIHRLKAPIIELSSTKIRRKIAEKASIRYLVVEKVRQKIEKEGWYT